MADTASKILQSASRLFATEGYVAASLSAVAEAAGTSKQVLLHHYGSKERLYLSVLREVGVKLAATVAKAQVEATGPASQLEQVLMSLLSPQNDELVRLTLRALLAIQSSDAQSVHWPLQPFLESLRTLALAASKKEMPRSTASMHAMRIISAPWACIGQFKNVFGFASPAVT